MDNKGFCNHGREWNQSMGGKANLSIITRGWSLEDDWTSQVWCGKLNPFSYSVTYKRLGVVRRNEIFEEWSFDTSLQKIGGLRWPENMLDSKTAWQTTWSGWLKLVRCPSALLCGFLQQSSAVCSGAGSGEGIAMAEEKIGNLAKVRLTQCMIREKGQKSLSWRDHQGEGWVTLE